MSAQGLKCPSQPLGRREMGGGSGSAGAAGESAAEAYVSDADPSRHHVLELCNLPEAAAALPDDQRFKLVR